VPVEFLRELNERDAVNIIARAPCKQLPEKNAADPKAVGRFIRISSIACPRVNPIDVDGKRALRISLATYV